MSKTITPPTLGKSNQSEDPAVQLIRAKVERALGNEPDAVEELAEVKAEKKPSKHQLYMQELSSQGKSLAEIQTAWHHYYTTLNDSEKHEVWQEFYAANQHTPYQKLFQKQQAVELRQRQPVEDASHHSVQADVPRQPTVSPSGAVIAQHAADSPKRQLAHSAAHHAKHPSKLGAKLVGKVNADGKLSLRHHLQSLAFGLATGMVVLTVFLFTFFNEYIIAPFIQPSRTVGATPIILNDINSNPSATPAVTVPKINIQIPIDFGETSTDESVIENGLSNGVVHYPSTVLPGQNGNGAYFGHSSGNIFNNGKYKFAFTSLHNLTTGDLFYITYHGTTYGYRVFARQVVPPSDVAVINDTQGKQATAELITCDPPGISTNRLVVWGEQIQPDISTNTNASATAVAAPTSIAGNGPTLWNKFIGKLEFWR